MIQKLCTTRSELGLTQTEVARKIKKPQSYVSKIERGERRLDATELREFADIYKKQINYFLNQSKT